MSNVPVLITLVVFTVCTVVLSSSRVFMRTARQCTLMLSTFRRTVGTGLGSPSSS